MLHNNTNPITAGLFEKNVLRSSERIEVTKKSRKNGKRHLEEENKYYGVNKKREAVSRFALSWHTEPCHISFSNSQNQGAKVRRRKVMAFAGTSSYEYSYTAVPGTNCCNVRISIYQVLLTAVTYSCNFPGFVCWVYQVQLLCSSTCCSPLYIWHVYIVPIHILAPYPWHHAVPKTIWISMRIGEY